MGGPVKGRADFLQLGDYNIACSMCGRKRKFSELVRNWQGLYRCPEHNEPRQPQDFARNVKDIMTVPWAQPQTDAFTVVTMTFPASIIPSPIELNLSNVQFLSENGSDAFLTEDSLDTFILDTAFFGEAFIILPDWVNPTSYAWTWKSGGAGIFIGGADTYNASFSASSTGLSGVVQCAIGNDLGGSATVTVQVNS